jgi:hypothetical protein
MYLKFQNVRLQQMEWNALPVPLPIDKVDIDV